MRGVCGCVYAVGCVADDVCVVESLEHVIVGCALCLVEEVRYSVGSLWFTACLVVQYADCTCVGGGQDVNTVNTSSEEDAHGLDALLVFVLCGECEGEGVFFLLAQDGEVASLLFQLFCHEEVG